MNYFIQGKKINFNDDIIVYENNENKNPNNENVSNNNRMDYNPNNLSNELFNQNNININNEDNNNNDYMENKEVLNKNSDNGQYENMNRKQMSNKIKCTCSKTGCLKKYCACYSKGIRCEGCDCKNCENQPNKANVNISEKGIEDMKYANIITNPKNQRVICNCTKSNCMKKYCECYKQGFRCNSLCRCLECKNKNEKYNCNNAKNNIINNNSYVENNGNLITHNNLSQVHDFSTSYIPDTFCRPMDYNNPINYQPEAFGIFIKKEKLKMNERKISLNSSILNNIIRENVISTSNNLNGTPKYSNKKRARTRHDISNMKTCPTTNSSNRRRRGLSSINKNIQKKKLQLN